jgi:hypothetical protein
MGRKNNSLQHHGKVSIKYRPEGFLVLHPPVSAGSMDFTCKPKQLSATPEYHGII